MSEYKQLADARTKQHDGRRKPAEEAINDDTDLIGVIAEGEFAKAYGLVFEKRVYARDDGYDYVLANGRKIDIKATKHKNGNLFVATEMKHEFVADAFVLAIVDTQTETAQFIGWATRDEVRNTPVKYFGKGYPVHTVWRRYLHPMSELFEQAAV